MPVLGRRLIQETNTEPDSDWRYKITFEVRDEHGWRAPAGEEFAGFDPAIWPATSPAQT